MIGKTVSHFEIREQLGQGGMGVVYRALDTKLGREIALKFLPPELSADAQAKARFVQEAQAASALDHPNICTIHEIGESEEGKLYIAMSLYEGHTLKYVLDGGAMAVDKAVDIVLQIAAGLRKAHDAGIVHRDIKPANVMVTSDGLIKILDFGLAKLGQGVDLTKAGSTVGTTAYMSPEQSSGQEVDGRTDLWSLGVLLYELVSGTRAFGGGYDQAVLYSVLNEDPAPLENVPEELGSIVSKLLAKKPDERYASAEEVSAALKPFSSGSGSHSESSPNAPAATGRPISGLRLVVAALVAVVAIVAWLMSSGGGAPEDPIADAETNRDRVAVLPFSVQGGPEMQYLSESMVTFLTTLLDGAGPIKAVDQATILEQIRPGDGVAVGPSAGSEFAQSVSAGWFVIGSVVKAGNENRLTARLYEADGTAGIEAISSFSGDDDLMSAVDEVAAGLVRGLLNDPEQELNTLAAETTTSFKALRHFLNAEAMVRAGRHREAYDEANRALAIDSTFALAWVLRSEAMGWIESTNPSIAADIETAIRYSGKLSGKVRRLLDGRDAFNRRGFLAAERIMKDLLRDYPTSIEAMGQLAEVYMHYSRKQSEVLYALKLIQQVETLSPGNQNYAQHHADAIALRGLLENDTYPMDSLAAVYAGMDVPERGDAFDWSIALDRMNGSMRGNMNWLSRVAGTPEDSVASYRRNLDGGLTPYRVLWFGYTDIAEATFERGGHHDFISLSAHHLSVLSQGQLERASGIPIHKDGDLPSDLLSADVLNSTLPILNTSEEHLRQLLEDVREWNVDVDRPRHPPEDGAKLKAYLMALLAFRLQLPEEFNTWHDRFASAPVVDSEWTTWSTLAAELDGLEAWMQNDPTRAIIKMEEAYYTRGSNVQPVYDLFSLRQQPQWFLAELNEQIGQLELAIDWYNATIDAPYAVAAGWENTARLYEELGDTQNAIRYYSLMAHRWRNADPVLQPRVEAARGRVDALLTSQAREPQ